MSKPRFMRFTPSQDIDSQVLRESLDFPEDLAPAVAEGTGAEATPETANPTQPGDGPDGTAAVQMPAPGSKSEVGEGQGKKRVLTENRHMTGK